MGLHSIVDVLNATELYLKIIKMVSFMLCMFYHNLEKISKDSKSRYTLVEVNQGAEGC